VLTLTIDLNSSDPQCDEHDLWGYSPESQAATLPILSSFDLSNGTTRTEQIGGVTGGMISLPWPLNFMDRTVELAIKELSVDSSRDEALQVSLSRLPLEPHLLTLISRC
jgi:hypothetical protein